MRSTEACYINKTYVEALGYTLPKTLTWDFIWRFPRLPQKKNPDGTYKLNDQEVMIPFIYKSTDNMMIQMLRSRGPDIPLTPDRWRSLTTLPGISFTLLQTIQKPEPFHL